MTDHDVRVDDSDLVLGGWTESENHSNFPGYISARRRGDFVSIYVRSEAAIDNEGQSPGLAGGIDIPAEECLLLFAILRRSLEASLPCDCKPGECWNRAKGGGMLGKHERKCQEGIDL